MLSSGYLCILWAKEVQTSRRPGSKGGLESGAHNAVTLLARKGHTLTPEIQWEAGPALFALQRVLLPGVEPGFPLPCGSSL